MALISGRMLLRLLSSGRTLLADGAMGTELIAGGVPTNAIVRANLDRPELVRDLHRSYLEAGAEWLTANTFGLDIGDEWAEALRSGLEIALQCAREHDRPVSVWLSLPATTVIRDRPVDRFLTDLLAEAAQPVLIETATSLNEAVAAVERVRERGSAPIACSCHFGPSGTMPDGTEPEIAALALIVAGADIVGANCGPGPEEFIEVTRRMRLVTDHPLLIRPNAGLPAQSEGGRWIYPVSDQAFAYSVRRAADAGATIVGGCCGTTPATARALRDALDPPETSRQP